jgi:hypothetical protein
MKIQEKTVNIICHDDVRSLGWRTFEGMVTRSECMDRVQPRRLLMFTLGLAAGIIVDVGDLGRGIPPVRLYLIGAVLFDFPTVCPRIFFKARFPANHMFSIFIRGTKTTYQFAHLPHTI